MASEPCGRAIYAGVDRDIFVESRPCDRLAFGAQKDRIKAPRLERKQRIHFRVCGHEEQWFGLVDKPLLETSGDTELVAVWQAT